MRFLNPRLGIVAAAFLSAGVAFSQPGIHGETANGKPIDLPAAAAGKDALLIFGFSKAGGHQTGAWEQRTTAEFGRDPHLAVYTIAMLEAVPRLLRGMIKSSIVGGIPPAKRANMVLAFSGETEWRRFCEVSDDKVPYLVFFDRTQHIRWKGHGLFDEKQYDALKRAIEDVLKEDSVR